jgi:hypothetical protein
MQTVTTIDSALYLAAAFTGDSFAADWPVRAISQAYYPGRLVPIEWTGVCFGVNAGYGWAKESSTIFFTGLTGGATTPAALGGSGIAASGRLSGCFCCCSAKNYEGHARADTGLCNSPFLKCNFFLFRERLGYLAGTLPSSRRRSPMRVREAPPSPWHSGGVLVCRPAI